MQDLSRSSDRDGTHFYSYHLCVARTYDRLPFALRRKVASVQETAKPLALTPGALFYRVRSRSTTIRLRPEGLAVAVYKARLNLA